MLLGKRKRNIIGNASLGKQIQIVNGKLTVVGEAGGTEGVGSRRTLRNPSEVESDGDDKETSEGSASASEYEDETASGLHDDEPVASTSRLATPTASGKASPAVARTSRSRSTSTKPKVRYECTWEGCDKSYTKPVRLAEHMRSHTGERPFKCTHEGCTSSYLRETHLQAHLRSHANDEQEKPLKCEYGDGCDKRFWTNQHLKRHVKLVHEQDKGAYQCSQCPLSFNKHHKLRSHVAEIHMPEGTNPFICTHEGCGKSYKTGSKLRAHAKVHDENRYICMHSSHTSQAPRFQTWSALQAHNKSAHPPTCPYPECATKTFASNKILKKHNIKWHLDGLLGASEEDSDSTSEMEVQMPERVRTRIEPDVIPTQLDTIAEEEHSSVPGVPDASSISDGSALACANSLIDPSLL